MEVRRLKPRTLRKVLDYRRSRKLTETAGRSGKILDEKIRIARKRNVYKANLFFSLGKECVEDVLDTFIRFAKAYSENKPRTATRMARRMNNWRRTMYYTQLKTKDLDFSFMLFMKHLITYYLSAIGRLIIKKPGFIAMRKIKVFRVKRAEPARSALGAETGDSDQVTVV